MLLTALAATLAAALACVLATSAVAQSTTSTVFLNADQTSESGDSIRALAWLHEDLLIQDERDLTFLFLYEASDGEQTKLATVTVTVESDGTFKSSGWGDVGEIEGTLGTVPTVDRVVIGNGDQTSDELTDLTFTALAPPSAAPATGRWPLIQTLPLSVTKPEYTDFWTVELEVTEDQGETRASLVYYGPDGTYPADPVTIGSNGEFAGTAGDSESGVSFAGVFLTLDDDSGGADYPILVQAPFEDNTAWRMSEAVGTRPILWLTESSSNKSGVEVESANYSTVTQAQDALDKLFTKSNVLAADTDDASTEGATDPPDDTYFERTQPSDRQGQYSYPVYNSWLCCTANIVPVRANDAWGVANATGQGISLAVLDTGVVANHADLQGRIQGGHNALRWPWWIDWLRLWIPANWRTTTTDLYGHGTGVSGIATAIRDNNEGIAGVAEPDIRPVRVLDQDKTASDTSIAEGLQWVLDNDHGDIINLSFVSGNDQDTHLGDWDPVVSELIRLAIESGRVVMAASGNQNLPIVLPPASVPDVLAVGASDSKDAPTTYSNYGQNLDLLAPGGESNQDGQMIAMPWLANTNCGIIGEMYDHDPEYCQKFGTSFSAPFVSGIVSMILTVHTNLQRTDANCAANPKDCVAQIRALVQRTGLAVQTPNWGAANVTDVYAVNAYQAVTAALPAALPPATNLQVANCVGAACINPGVQLQWNAAVAPGGFNLQGYLVFRNGRPFFQGANNPNLLVVNATNYADTSIPATNAGVPENGTYTYTVIALYQDTNNNVFEQAISSNHVAITCAAAGCN